ncbi:MAG: zinc-dependent alcohol dehydrogenase [Pseudonocardiaceae bacterium]
MTILCPDVKIPDVQITAPRTIQVRWAAAAAKLSSGEALVEIDRVSLCGSDYRLYDGTYGGPMAYPMRFGHEWSGRVLEAGPAVGLAPGTPVTGDCSRYCSSCDRCVRDRNLCRTIEKFGLTVPGFSIRRRVVDQRYLYPDPYDLDPGVLALTEIFAVAMHGLAAVLPDLPTAPYPDAVLIVGAGALGMATMIAAAHHYGIGEVHLLEIDAEKAASVRRRAGTAQIIDAPEPGAIDGLKTYAAISAMATYPLVVDCSGSALGLSTALALADVRGMVLCFGLGSHGPSRTDLVVTKALTVQGSIGGTGAFPDALALLSRQQDLARTLLTHLYPAAKARDAFESTAADPTRIKTQITFDEEA